MNFNNSNLSDSNLTETRFGNCSFRETKLRRVNLSAATSDSCDFTNADITGSQVALNTDQLMATLNFKRKDLSYVSFDAAYDDVDFSNFDFRNSSFAMTSKWKRCDFTDAEISGSRNALTAEQLRDTYDYKKKDLSNTTLCGDLSGLSFAGFDLRGTSFSGLITGCDFNDADIAGASFTGSLLKKTVSIGSGMSSEQLYSTRSFKEKNMAGVAFHFCKLHDFDFSGQTLGIFIACDLAKANFMDATFSRPRILGPRPKDTFCGVSGGKNFTFNQFASTRTFKSKQFPQRLKLPDGFRDRSDGRNDGAGDDEYLGTAADL